MQMAAKCSTYFLFTMLFIKYTKTFTIHFNIPEIEQKDFTVISHLDNPKIKIFCEKRKDFCQYGGTKICALRSLNGNNTYKHFANGCFLFMSNMCDNPGNEFHIVSSGSCEDYLAVRRNEETLNTTEANSSLDTESSSNETDITTEPAILRENVKVTTPMYEVDEAYDSHPCPPSCIHTYSPVCINVNRGYGKYFKMYTFVNHCMADLYYCRHPNEFLPPPDEDQDELLVRSSPLAWSFCGASRYLQFARFAEVTSSMGHYGWLAGNYPFSHIMEPHERLPDHG